MTSPETKEEEPSHDPEDAEPGEAAPGLVLIFSGDRPAFEVIPLERGAIVLGRGEVAGVHLDDERMSRAHARVAFDGRRWLVKDLGSRNGTAVNGERLSDMREGEALRFVRAGSSLLLLVTDTRPFRAGISHVRAMVMGPALQRTFKSVVRAARAGRVLHVTGETGSGKELRAERARRHALPRRGGRARSWRAGQAAAHARDRRGRPAGATSPERVDLRLCSATHASLRARVAAGRLRADLFFRIGTPAVALPPLRERLEEIPWLVERALQKGDDGASGPLPYVSLVEACLSRPWPGNVRELLTAVRQAAELAADEGNAVLARHLDEDAGTALEPQQPSAAYRLGGASAGAQVSATAPPSRPHPAARPSDEAIMEALRISGGNIARAARAVGMHRTQLYRWMARREGRAEPDDEG